MDYQGFRNATKPILQPSMPLWAFIQECQANLFIVMVILKKNVNELNWYKIWMNDMWVKSSCDFRSHCHSGLFCWCNGKLGPDNLPDAFPPVQCRRVISRRPAVGGSSGRTWIGTSGKCRASQISIWRPTMNRCSSAHGVDSFQLPSVLISIWKRVSGLIPNSYISFSVQI